MDGVPADPEEDELVRVALQLVEGDDEAEVVQEEELQFELVELREGEATDLRGSRRVASVSTRRRESEAEGKERTFAYREFV